MRFVLAAFAFFAIVAPAAAAPVEIRVLSNRADLVSGGDALVEVVGPPGVRVTAAGRDVTDAFAVRGDGRFAGLVSGLPVGRSRIVATAPGGEGASLVVTNHPRSGPLFAGPQTRPWLCAEGSSGSDCNAPTTYRLVYKPDRPYLTGFADYDPAAPPADVATTTTDAGRTVPFIVRVETGVMDRGIYSIAALYDPKKPWTAFAPQAGGDGKGVWPFRGDRQPGDVQD